MRRQSKWSEKAGAAQRGTLLLAAVTMAGCVGQAAETSNDFTPKVLLIGIDGVREALDGYELGWAEADKRSVDFAVGQLRSSDPDALFVYLGNPDETSHQTSSIGEEYRAAIILADAEVGRLVQAMESRPTYATEDWLVLVSTDHWPPSRRWSRR